MKIKAGSFKKIKSNADMYCMTVEENHTFVLEENKHRFIVKNCMQNEWAGAQAVNSFDTYMAPFVRLKRLEIIEEYKSLNVSIDAAVEAAVEKKLYKYVKQCMQTLLYGINTPSRWGSQAPFSNVTLDLSIPEDLREKKPFIGGKTCSFTYGDCDKEVDLLNMAFLSVYEEGDFVQSGFQYPIITINVDEEFNWRNEVAEKLFTITSKYGTPYFSNFINTGMTKKDLRSMCCLHPDTKIDVELEEDIVELEDGTYLSLSNAKKKGIID